MEITNKSGDGGTPYRSPLPWLIGAFSMPFMSTWKEAVDNIIAIQFHHLVGKPNLLIVSRYCHHTKSNAFVISSLNKKVGTLFLCRHLMVLHIDKKLSWMFCYFMNAL